MKYDAERFRKRIQVSPAWRKLTAYSVGKDGACQRLECEGIYIEVEEESGLGLLIPLHERYRGEGVPMISLPEAEVVGPPLKPGQPHQVKGEHAVLRAQAGAANLLYVAPWLASRLELLPLKLTS